jgi:hypothetical protein
VRGGCAALGLIILISSVQGCSQDGGATAVHGQALTRQVLSLRNGESLDEVTQTLGEPDSKTIDGSGDGAFHYGRWQLTFQEGALKERTEELRRGQGGDNRIESGLSTREVLSLRRGMPLGAVRAMLGKPDVVELVYREGSKPEKVLRYGPWELQFSGGVLRARTHW